MASVLVMLATTRRDRVGRARPSTPRTCGRGIARLAAVIERARCRLLTCLALALALTVVASAIGASQVRPPGGTTPGGAILDRLQRDTTRPAPPVAPPRGGPADDIWVPDRHVRVPGVEGAVLVPGHWERRESEHDVYVPPLTGQASDGRIIQFPAAQRPLPTDRQSP
jgi:hypothetical protein